MGWVSPKVYAILSNSEEGKDILVNIADKNQKTVDKEVDEFFGNHKGLKKGEVDETPLSSEQKKKVSSTTKLIWGGTRGHTADPELEKSILKVFDDMPEEYNSVVLKVMDEKYVQKFYQSQGEGCYNPFEHFIALDRYDLTENPIYAKFSVLVHESGHAVDNMLGDKEYRKIHNNAYEEGTRFGRYASSTYISSKYPHMTLADMIIAEASNYDLNALKELVEEDYANDNIKEKLEKINTERDNVQKEFNSVKYAYIDKRKSLISGKFGENSETDWSYQRTLRNSLIQAEFGSMDNYLNADYDYKKDFNDRANDIINEKMKEYKSFVENLEDQDEVYKKISTQYNALRDKFRDLDNQAYSLNVKKMRDWGDVADLIGGVHLQRGTNDVDFGHPASYWGADGSARQRAVLGRECFAELFAGKNVNMTSYLNMKRMFPKSVDIFEEIMEYAGK